MIVRSLAMMMLIGMLTACSSGHAQFNWAKPANLNMVPPKGPPEYEQGWKDGCQSGWKAYATQFNKVWGSYKQDPILAQNPVYYQVWKDAYSYCSVYALSIGEHGLMDYDGDGRGGVFDTFGKWGDQTMPEYRNPWANGVTDMWVDPFKSDSVL